MLSPTPDYQSPRPTSAADTVGVVQLGADSGGTFTDVVGIDGTILKIPSTPSDPAAAVRSAMALLGAGRVELLAHGTTVATNALLERSGVQVALVTTEGFGDVIEIGRQHRPSLYDPWVDRPAPLVPRHARIEVVERLDARGDVLVALETEPGPVIPEACRAVAICLLHADLNDCHERALAEQLRAAGHDVTASHEVAPEFREYERTVTTVLNASLRPVCRPYLESLADAADQVAVMTSAGGLIDVATAGRLPVSLLLSGPAGGVRAAAAVAAACGFPDAISFDMGGTSTDVALILAGEPAPASVREIAGLPVLLPSLDIHTVGAGGGSIASIDAGGALVVGPRSAGARPGPACYGLGGDRPTVTDANLVLGRLPEVELAGIGRLDLDGAERAFAAARVDAGGVISVVNANMEQALRAVSVERGVDPAGLALIAFGGAGPLHACELADAVGMPTVIVPAAAGVLSAVGLLTSPMRRDLVRSWNGPSEGEDLERAAAQLGEDARTELAPAAGIDPGRVEVELSVDARYVGQSHEIRVGTVDAFHEAHRRLNGYDRPGQRIEVTAIRAVARAEAAATAAEVLGSVPHPVGEPTSGPLAIARDDCAIWIPEGWQGRPGPLGSMLLERT